MGGGRLSSDDWSKYAKKSIDNARSVDQIFTSKGMQNKLDPKGVKVRESCDSDSNSNSTAVIVGLDVTGSMSPVIDSVARVGLKKLVDEIYSRKPIADPHIMFAGIGDVAAGSRAPLQVTQFEADIRIAEQLAEIWLEGGGGGNGSESYALLWYFAAYHTSIDCMKKRGKKGVLFTIGDDGPTPSLNNKQLESVFGYIPEIEAVTSMELLTAVSRLYDVFHISLSQGQSYDNDMKEKWDKLLGERHIVVDDHTKISEVIVSTLQMLRGDNYGDVVNSWDKSTSLVVGSAIKGLSKRDNTGTGVVKF